MTAVITGDWHLNDLERDAYRFRAAELIINHAIKIKASHLFILGDLTDEKDNHSAVLVNKVVELLEKASPFMDVVIVRGNHDAIDPKMPFFEFLNSIPNLSLVTDIDTMKVDGLTLALIAHGSWPEILPRADFILTHATFKGAKVKGFELDGIDLLMGAVPIISGDVHVPQTVGRVTYVGAPTLIDFGDDYEPRILTLSWNGPRSHKVTAPTKRLIVWDESGAAPTAGFRARDIVKVKVLLTQDRTPGDVAALRDKIRQWAETNKLVLHAIHFDLPKAAKVRAAKPGVKRDDADMVKAYGRAQNFSDATIAVGLVIVGGGQ